MCLLLEKNMNYSLDRYKTIGKTIIFVIVVAVSLSFLQGSTVHAKSDTAIDLYLKGSVDYDFADEILMRVNNARVDEGLPILTMNTEVTDSANIRARECILKYSHRRPVSDEWTALMPSGYTHVGENLAIGYERAESVVAAWLNSPTHKANIMNGEYVSIGIGVFRYNNPATDKTLYACVQHFSNTSSNDKAKSGQDMSSYPVTVDTDIYPVEVNLSINGTEKKKISMHQGEKLKPIVTINAEEIWGDDDITVEPMSLNWKVNKEDTVKVSKEGLLSAVGVGETTVCAFTTDGKFEKTLNILVKTPINSVKMNKIPPQLYTGERITPTLILSNDKKELVEGKDYKIRYSDNIYPGTASINIIGKDGYGGSGTIYFSIYDESTEIKESWWSKIKDFFGFD